VDGWSDLLLTAWHCDSREGTQWATCLWSCLDDVVVSGYVGLREDDTAGLLDLVMPFSLAALGIAGVAFYLS
jgi:hypothetical protein